MDLATAHLPDSSARAIRDLELWNGRLYIAYGAAQERQGPLDTLYLNLSSGKIVRDKEDALDQDELVLFREIDDVLFTPGIAPHDEPAPSLIERLIPRLERPVASNSSPPFLKGSIYVRRPESDHWHKLTIPNTIKAFDIAAYRNALYAAATGIAKVDEGGEQRYRAYAAVFRSWDGGSVWELAYKEDTLLQFSELHVFGDKLYATAGGIARVYDGERWSPVQVLPENSGIVRKHLLFQHLLVLLPDLSWNGPLFLYDGRETHTIHLPNAVRDAVVAEGWLYVLTSNAAGQTSLWETQDTRCRCPSSFNQMRTFELESTATALEYAQGRFYVGTEDGYLYQLEAWR